MSGTNAIRVYSRYPLPTSENEFLTEDILARLQKKTIRTKAGILAGKRTRRVQCAYS